MKDDTYIKSLKDRLKRHIKRHLDITVVSIKEEDSDEEDNAALPDITDEMEEVISKACIAPHPRLLTQ
jgi:hypothetical protein